MDDDFDDLFAGFDDDDDNSDAFGGDDDFFFDDGGGSDDAFPIEDSDDDSGLSDFDSLRNRSTRANEAYSDLDEDFGFEDGDDSGGGGGGMLSRFSPMQRLILALLFFLDVLALGCGILVVTGLISF